MIVELPDTSTSAIASKIDELHERRGEAALGRVLTLLVCTDAANLEDSLATANAASREHPCRVIAIVTEGRDVGDDARLDAQVRFGADAGAGEIIVLRPTGGLTRHLDTLVIPLLVPDAPVVAWWPTRAPENPSADPIGMMARSRITDAMRAQNPEAAFTALRAHYTDKDIDMSWTRLTMWRATLASLLEERPASPIRSVRVLGQPRHLSVELLGSWLALKLGVPVVIDRDGNAEGVAGVTFVCEDGEFGMHRENERMAVSLPGEFEQTVPMPMRTPEDCLSEELRRLDPDEVYAEVIERGWTLVDHE